MCWRPCSGASPEKRGNDHGRAAHLVLRRNLELARCEHPRRRRVETNVVRFYESIAQTRPDGSRQTTWYDDRRRHQLVRPRSSAAPSASGLDEEIQRRLSLACRHLSRIRIPTISEIFILGFSRGAYTARSLVGMIRNVGLLHAGERSPHRRRLRALPRSRREPRHRPGRAFRARYSRDIEIRSSACGTRSARSAYRCRRCNGSIPRTMPSTTLS